MVNQLDIEILASLFGAIWQRNPIIFVLNSKEDEESVLETLFNFVPMYRQLIVCGELSKKFFFEQKPAKYLNISDHEILLETLETCYKEDGLLSPPIQLLYIDAKKVDFEKVLRSMSQGWIALTFEKVSELSKLFNNKSLKKVALNKNVSVLFVDGLPADTALEKQILQKCVNKASTVFRYIMQMRLYEVHFICRAFLDEIEKGQYINQIEAEEQFEIDYFTFLRAIDVLEREYHVKPQSYIEFTSTSITELLKKFIRIDGVLAAVAVKNGKIIAMEKIKNILPNTSNLFVPFVDLFEQSNQQGFWGTEQLLIIKMREDVKLLFCSKYLPLEEEQIQFSFLLDAKVQITLMMSEMERIIEIKN